MRTNPASADLSDRLIGSVGQATSARATPGLYRALLRLLSRGKPVTIAELAAAAGDLIDRVQRAVAGWNDTEYDEEGRIVGWGLTLRATPYRFNIDGKQLYTWCALDTLFFPAVIGRPARAESPCAATGIPIRLTVDPTEGVSALELSVYHRIDCRARQSRASKIPILARAASCRCRRGNAPRDWAIYSPLPVKRQNATIPTQIAASQTLPSSAISLRNVWREARRA